MDLDNEDSWKGLDLIGVQKALTLFPDQINECWKQAYASDIPQLSPKSLVVSGMGGSSNAAKILQGLYESELEIPFEVHNDYGLPAWVNSDTLVVANSYSGNTEETLSSIDFAKKVGAKVLGVATSGKIADMIKSGEISGAIITPGDTNPTGFPKTGLGVSFGALAGVLSKARVMPLKEEELTKALDELKIIRKFWVSGTAKENNIAKQEAEWLLNSIPILFSGRPFLGSLNAGRNVICEVGRTFCLFFDFPEVDHVLIEATQEPDVVKDKVRYLFFVSKFNNERVLARYKITESIFSEQGSGASMHHDLQGSTKLVQALEIPHLCSWIGFYLSMLNSQDPGPEPWITKLKRSLSQPIH